MKKYYHKASKLEAIWNDTTKTYWIEDTDQEYELPAILIENSTEWVIFESKDKEVIKEEVKSLGKIDTNTKFVRCIEKSRISNYIGEIEKIYKVINYQGNYNLDLENNEPNIINKALTASRFIPATEEEYNLQEGIIKEPIAEEVKFDYTILSIKNPQGEIFTDSGNINAWLEGFGSSCFIYSVRRESDGEIFIIGDTIGHRLLKDIRNVISSIDSPSVDNIIYFNGGIHISNAVKIIAEKQPIFITEDKEEVFKGDTVYGIAIQASGKDCFKEMILHHNDITLNTTRKWFKYKENAQHYFIENHACLSYKETINTMQDGTFALLYSQKSKLYKSIQEKLKDILE